HRPASGFFKKHTRPPKFFPKPLILWAFTTKLSAQTPTKIPKSQGKSVNHRAKTRLEIAIPHPKTDKSPKRTPAKIKNIPKRQRNSQKSHSQTRQRQRAATGIRRGPVHILCHRICVTGLQGTTLLTTEAGVIAGQRSAGTDLCLLQRHGGPGVACRLHRPESANRGSKHPKMHAGRVEGGRGFRDIALEAEHLNASRMSNPGAPARQFR
ncbi:hypothetical protein, partial [Celeribacter neptunius]